MARLPALLVCLMLVWAPVLADDAADRAARDRVEQFHAQIIDMMRSDLPFNARQRAVHDAVGQNFSLNTVSRVSLGAGWRQLDAAQQAKVHQALHSLISATYASRFTSYNGQDFTTLSSEQMSPRLVVVRTRLTRVDGEPVEIRYHVDPGGIFNVIVNGVSDLSMRRAQYGALFRQEGFTGLLQEIKRQTDALQPPEPNAE